MAANISDVPALDRKVLRLPFAGNYARIVKRLFVGKTSGSKPAPEGVVPAASLLGLDE